MLALNLPGKPVQPDVRKPGLQPPEPWPKPSTETPVPPQLPT